ncbi:MAG: hypothetical protein RJB14_3068 [Pseudomonadota bacterium]|jgi:ribosomal protein S18 acetylase RimI-like enzyme
MSLDPTFELVHVEQAEHWDAFVSLMREYVHLIEQARTAGFDRMGLSTWRSNTLALSLYERMGFAAMPAFKNHPDPDLVYLGMTLTALDAVTTHTP